MTAAEMVIKDIAFASGRRLCRGHHYSPLRRVTDPSSAKLPCIILAHGFGGTADAGLEPYARRFAEAGFHAITFDYRHFGRSDGQPRQLVSIRRQLQDWHAAIVFARAQKGIDPERIIVWGVSLAGGHVIRVAAEDKRIYAVIAQFPMLDGPAALSNICRYAGYGQIIKLLAAGARDGIRSLFGRRPVLIPIVGDPGEVAALSTSDAKRGYLAIVPPGWQNAVCARIAFSISLYRPGLLLRKITAPVLIQVAERDTILPPRLMVKRFLSEEIPNLQVRHYRGGHFDAFSGKLFQSAVRDQLDFISGIMRETCCERKPA